MSILMFTLLRFDRCEYLPGKKVIMKSYCYIGFNLLHPKSQMKGGLWKPQPAEFSLGYFIMFYDFATCLSVIDQHYKGRRGNHELFRFSYNFNSLSSDYTMYSYHSIPSGNNPWFHILFVCIIVLTKGRFSRVLNIQKSILVLLFFVDG